MGKGAKVKRSNVVLTPVDLSTATQVGPRTYRKQILRKVAIDYPTPDGREQRVDFDDAYLAEVAKSFNDGAYDLAPFILADEQNRHTLAPERYKGELKAVEVTPDGLDGIIELAPDAAELVERTGRRLGVSCRIKSDVKHVDGRRFNRAIHHVLGTLDGRMQGPTHGLSPWEPIDLATSDNETVLDLSGIRYQEATMPRNVEHLSDDEWAALSALAEENGIDLSEPDPEPAGEPAPADPAPADPAAAPAADEPAPAAEGDGITDEELDALIDAELESMGIQPAASGRPKATVADDGVAATGAADTSLSAADDGLDEGDTLDLTTPPEQDEAAVLRAQLAGRDYLAAGVPPFAVDLAAPILAAKDGDDTLDLASPVDGSPVDVRSIVTGLLDLLKGTIDLSREDGYAHDEGGQPQRTAAESAWLKHLGAENLIEN